MAGGPGLIFLTGKLVVLGVRGVLSLEIKTESARAFGIDGGEGGASGVGKVGGGGGGDGDADGMSDEEPRAGENGGDMGGDFVISSLIN